MASTWRALRSVTSSEEPTGVYKLTVVSEKSAFGTNSVPSSGTMTTLVAKISAASASVTSRWRSDQARMPW